MARRIGDAVARPPERGRPGGVVRHVDELGRIVIPVEIRKRFGIKMRDPLEITVRGDSVVLTKPRDTCVFCNGNRGLTEFRGRRVCGDCVNALIGDVIHA